MRRVAAVLVLALMAGCSQPHEKSSQDRAWDWLLDQRDEGGRWPAAFVPHVVEAAAASGRDPAVWPSPVPLAEQMAWPSEGGTFMSSLRSLHAWSLLPQNGGRGEDITERLLAGYDGRQFGDAALLNDDAYALLALGAIDPALAASHAASLAENQSAEGGWAWSPAGKPETDMTGIVLVALARAAVGGFDPAAARGFLDRTHQAGGGHSMHVGGEANCDSTAWAMHGYKALRTGAPEDDRAFLASLQREDGSLAYQPSGGSNALCTVEAVPLLQA